MFCHAACNAATVLLIYRLGKRIANEQSAFVVALCWAMSPPLIWMPTIFWETNLSALLLPLLIECSLLMGEDGVALWRPCVCGALCGLAGLINPALLATGIFVMVRAFVAQPRSENWRLRTATFSLTFVLVFAGWPLRNYNVFHRCILTRTSPGLELWMGNHEGGSGYLEQAMFPTFNRAELARYSERGEIAFMASKMELARTYIFAHPGRFVSLSGRRCIRFWAGDGSRPSSPLFFLHGTVSTLLGFGGLWILWRDKERSLSLILLAPLLLFPLPYYVAHAEFRYRLVLDPVLVILSARAFDMIMRLSATAGRNADPKMVAHSGLMKNQGR